MATCVNPTTVENVTDNAVECIVTDKRLLGTLPTQEQPFAIIKYGPTGSGKGSPVVQKEIEALGVKLADCAVFEIDSIVESIRNYREKTYKVKTNFNEKTKLNINTRRNSNRKKHFFNELSSIYFGARKGIDPHFDNVLFGALDTKKHIIFETTGTNFNGRGPLEWIIDEITKRKVYKIVVIYPLVEASILKKRVEARGEQQASSSKPEENRFYRGIDPDTLPELANNSKMNLTHFILPNVFVKKIHKLIVVWNQ